MVRPDDSLTEIHDRPGCVDLPEVHYDSAVVERGHRVRRDRQLGDAGPLGVQVGERRGADRSHHRSSRPAAVVVVGCRPSSRRQASVDDLYEVTGVGVALCGGQPLGGTLLPGSVGPPDKVASVGEPHRDLGHQAGGRLGSSLSGAVPMMEEPDCVSPTCGQRSAHVGRLEVLLVRIAEARPGVELLAVHPELVLVSCCRVDDGVIDSSGGDVEHLSQIGVLLETRVRRTRAKPLRAPVGLAQARHEDLRFGFGAPRPVFVAGGDAESVCGVGFQRRSCVSDEGLPARPHLARVPHGRAVCSRSRHGQAVGGLDSAFARICDLPRKAHVVRIDSDRRGVPVDPERSGGSRQVCRHGCSGLQNLPFVQADGPGGDDDGTGAHAVHEKCPPIDPFHGLLLATAARYSVQDFGATQNGSMFRPVVLSQWLRRGSRRNNHGRAGGRGGD